MRARFPLSTSALAAALIALGCAAAPPNTGAGQEIVVTKATKRRVVVGTPGPQASPGPGTGGDPTGASASPGGAASPATTVPGASPSTGGTLVVDDFMGVVLKSDGKPAANIKVFGYPTASAGVSAYRRTWRLQQVAAPLQVLTDAQGRFTLAAPGGGALNLEAVESDTMKAFEFNVPASARGLRLQLAATGTVKGQVKIPGLESLGGIVVKIPGTPYQAVTNEKGEYTIPNVPMGSNYAIYASKDGVGVVNVPNVTVPANSTTTVKDATIAGNVPVLTALSPTMGGKGTNLTITGTNFPEKDLKVEFGALSVDTFTRVSSTELQVKVPAEGAVGEDIRLVLAGTPSNALMFKLLSGIAVNAAATTLTVGATQTFTASAIDAAGLAIASPTVRWEISGGDACTVDAASGLVTAAKVGTANLLARSGDLLSRAIEITVTSGGTGGGTGGGGTGGGTGGVGVRAFTVTTLAGGAESIVTDGPLASARFLAPTGVALNFNGDASTLYVVDNTANLIRRVTATEVQSVAGAAEAGVTDGAGTAVRFDFPLRISFNRFEAGVEAYTIADQRNHRIRRFTPATGAITTLAGGGSGGVAGGAFAEGVGTSARFFGPGAAVMGPGGAIFVADSFNHCIRRIDPNTAAVTVFAGAAGQAGNLDGVGGAARFSLPSDLAIAADGTLYVADQGNALIREITTAGLVSTVLGRDLDQAGGATNATFSSPYGLALDGANRLYVSDNAEHRIRVVDLAASPRTVTTLAGTANTAGFADGGTPQFNQPQSLCVDAVGDLYVADTGNRRIRKLTFAK